MSDQTEYEDGTDDEPQEDLRELRAAAKQGKAAKAEAEAARRELAFAKAGIDTDSAKGKMFVKAYDGELDQAAIRGQFEELFGADQAPPEPEPTGLSDEQKAERVAQTQDRRDLASAGSDPDPTPEPDLVEQGYKRMQQSIQDGRPMELAFREALSGTIAAANQGQSRALWSGWSDEQMDGYTR